MAVCDECSKRDTCKMYRNSLDDEEHILFGCSDGEDSSGSDEDERTIRDVVNTMTEEQKEALYYVVGLAVFGKKPKENGYNKRAKEVISTFNTEQRTVLSYILYMNRKKFYEKQKWIEYFFNQEE